MTDLYFYVDNRVSEWEIDALQKFEKLKKDSVNVHFALKEIKQELTVNEKLTLHKISVNYNILNYSNKADSNYLIHLQAKTANGEIISYITDKKYKNLNEKWLWEHPIHWYRIDDLPLSRHQIIDLPNISSVEIWESKITGNPQIKSGLIAEQMMNNFSSYPEIINEINRESVIIRYYDKYNLSELSLRLLLQFIDSLQKLFNFNVNNLEIHLNEDLFKREYKTPYYIHHNYECLNDYIYDAKKMSSNFNFEVKVIKNYELPHYRYFSIESKKHSIQLRVDAGLAHGWKTSQPLKSENIGFKNIFFDIYKNVNHDLIYILTSVDN